ncbi:GLPGLI family protein [Halpernia humi]|uniref:GLPGLI family protein n=2 Tax=Halpernia humi TaxID=493375 RepID=A0A1H5V1W8_9FLAO|nr:GLPGLI family protein [Halpernia humi]
MRVLFISILLSSSFFSSQIKISYEVKYKPDSTKMYFNTEEMMLSIDNGTSYFYNLTKFKLDSIYDQVTAQYAKTGVSPSVSMKYELKFGIFKDFKKEKFTEISNIAGKNFAFEIPKPKLKWKFMDSEKTIFNYSVKKAVVNFGGRSWTAWYAPEIPISEGPYKFYGLPGLILEISDSKGDYTFWAKGIEKNTNKIILPGNLISTTSEKYIKLVDKLVQDPAMFTRETFLKYKNVKMKDTSGSDMSANDLYKRVTNEFRNFQNNHNNPIEKGISWIQ